MKQHMNKGEIIANEAWSMIPDKAKEIMKGMEDSFKESIAADVNDLFAEN